MNVGLHKEEYERTNVQAQGRCAALSRSVPWSAVLGKHTIDLLARRLATADFQEA